MNKNNIIPNLNPNDLQRFWSKVIKTGSCWEWTSSKSNGYGQFWLNGKLHMVHRITYTLYKDVIPNNLTIDHLCRNRSCVNPDHLEPVTRSVNLRRGIGPEKNKARLAASISCKNGHPWNKDNTSFYVDRDGYKIRVCKTCSRIKQRKYKNRIK